MSERNNHGGDKAAGERSRTMLSSMIALEETRLGGGLDAGKIAAVKARLAAEKAAILNEFDRAPALTLQKKPGRAKVWGSLAAAALMVMGIGVVWLVRAPATGNGSVAYAKGTVRLNGAPIPPGTRLPAAGIITTEGKSLAVLRLANPVTALALAKSELQLKAPTIRNGLPDRSLALTSGRLFAQVDRGAAHFSVTTPTAVLAVRGTSFSIEVSAAGTTLRVLEGTVEASVGTAQGIPVEAGQRLSINPTTGPGKIAALSEAEKNELKSFAGLVALGREKADTSPVNQADVLASAILADETQPAPTAKMTLSDIRAKYGKISKVNLKNGNSYTGFFTLKGAQMEIITPAGTVRVPTAQLKDVQDVN